MKKKRTKNLNIGGKVSADTKLSKTALLLSYAFDYGVDFQHRTIRISGDITEGWFDIVDAALTQMEAESKSKVTVKINSPGGCTYEAMAIVGRLTSSKCYIVTEGFGHIMSAASLILACGDRRRISKYAWYMWHEASYYIDGRHSANKATVEQIEREEVFWCDSIATFSNEVSDYWKAVGIGKDAYFSAEKLIELGVADEVI